MLRVLALLTAIWSSAAVAQNITGGGSSAPIPTMASSGFSAFTTTQGTATLADSLAGVTVSDTDQSADNMRASCKTAPSTPYTVTGKFTLNTSYSTAGDSWGGFAWRRTSNGNLIGYGILGQQGGTPPDLGSPSVWSINFSNQTTYGGSNNGSVMTYVPTIWLQMSDDGANAIQRYSMDGINYITLSSVAKSGGYLGATGYNQVCIFVSAHGSAAKLSLNSYSQQ